MIIISCGRLLTALPLESLHTSTWWAAGEQFGCCGEDADIVLFYELEEHSMRHFDELDKRLDYIEFRQELLFENTDLTRLLFEYEIDRKQYKKIMDLMEAYRKKLDNKESVNHGTFETEMFRIVPECHEDYHMCEYIARAFMDEHRWEEVFPALYGDMPKYKFLKSENG